MAVHHLSWLESGVVGGMQGVAELFPVSSLGHSVLLPAVVGGSWPRDLNVVHAGVALPGVHRRPARRDGASRSSSTSGATGCASSRAWSRASRRERYKRPTNAWRGCSSWPRSRSGSSVWSPSTGFARRSPSPIPTAVFLIVNGFILLGAEVLRRRDGAVDTEYVDERVSGPESDAAARAIAGAARRR